MEEMLKIAGMQTEPLILEKEFNLKQCLKLTELAAKKAARLIIFPECALTGYNFTSLSEAIPVAETVPGPSTDIIMDLCRRLNVFVILGMIEKYKDKYYNASVFLGPAGLIGKYRKLHLPYEGIDRFLNHGDLPLQVYETEIGRIGLGICYDMNFPEHGRTLALKGADIVVNITNWPQGVEFAPDYIIHSRAIENHVYYLAVDRVGTERGIRFIGSSKFVNPLGDLIIMGDPIKEDILYAEIDPKLARNKHVVNIPGEIEVDCLGDRRPEFYDALIKPKSDNSRIR